MTEKPQPIAATARTELILPEKAESSLATAGLSSEGATSLRRAFSAHFAHFNDISKEAIAVRPDEPAKARALRLALKNIRTASERTRKELKEDSLRRGKAIDGIRSTAVPQYQRCRRPAARFWPCAFASSWKNSPPGLRRKRLRFSL